MYVMAWSTNNRLKNTSSLVIEDTQAPRLPHWSPNFADLFQGLILVFPAVKFKGGNLKIDVVVAEHGKTWIVPETYDVCDLFRIKSSADFVWDVYA